MRKYQPWFEIVNSEEEARELRDRINRSGTPYTRRRYPAFYTPWNCESLPGRFVVWSYR